MRYPCFEGEGGVMAGLAAPQYRQLVKSAPGGAVS
jgi:hypothetical protein